jgi:hypothetical protein
MEGSRKDFAKIKKTARKIEKDLIFLQAYETLQFLLIF